MEIEYRFGFDAAHHFDHYPEGHANRGMHGHSFQVEVAIAGEARAESGFITDFGEIARICDEIVRSRLDHRVLNDIDGLANPSLENLAIWIWRALAPRLPGLSQVRVRRESCGQSCTYKG